MSAVRHSFAVSLLLASSVAAISQATVEPNVVVSIKSIHSLVSSVMRGAGEPMLLIEGAQSPHSFSLKPSQAAALQNADAVIWVGPALESFLGKSLESIAPNVKSIELMEVKGINHLESDGHDHDGHEDEHAGEGHDEHKDEHAEHDEDEAGRDPHIWLDPENARVIVDEVAEKLAALDPENADLYSKNAASTKESLGALVTEVKGKLSAVKGSKFMAFHDAYGHFENRFGVESAGSLTINPEVSPGAKRLRELQVRVKTENIKCVFSEPQFDANAWQAVIENTKLKLGVIDPLGVEIAAGPDMYSQLIRDVTDSLTGCMTQ